MVQMLQGKKIYIVGIALVFVAGLHSIACINDQTYETLKSALLGGGIMTIAARIKRLLQGVVSQFDGGRGNFT